MNDIRPAIILVRVLALVIASTSICWFAEGLLAVGPWLQSLVPGRLVGASTDAIQYAAGQWYPWFVSGAGGLVLSFCIGRSPRTLARFLVRAR